MAITRAQQARQMLKEGTKKPVKQAGATNYLGKQEMVTAPKFWLSEPGHVKAKLAYITDEEEKILIDKNLYGSLKGKPNIGPAGLPSLQGGDFGSEDKGSDNQSGGGGGSDGPAGGASAGGDYGGNVRADQTYGGREFQDQSYASQESINRAKERQEQRTRDRIAREAREREQREREQREREQRERERIAREEAERKALDRRKRMGAKYVTDMFRLPADYDEEKDDTAAMLDLFVNDPYREDRTKRTLPTALGIGLNLLEKPFQAGAKKTREFFSGPTTDIFGRKQKGVLAGGKFNYKGEPLTEERFAKMSLTEKNQAYKDYTGQRNSGIIDAYGNLAPGVRRETTPFRRADGTIEMREQIFDNRDDGRGDQIFFPQNTTPGNGDDSDDSDDDDDTNTGGLALRFRKDGGRINAMDGGMMSPEGGIMDLETGRQMYFLGKLVKKATRAVKKIVKSPIGKAAILGGAMYFGGPKLSSFFGKGTFFGTGFNPLKDSTKIGPMSSGLGKFLSKFGLTDFVTGDLTKKGLLSLGGGALALSPFLFQGDDDEEDLTIDRGPGLDIAAIRANPYDFLGQRFRAEEGGKAEPVAKKTMPLLDMGGKEMDLREDGGFVPIGRMEKADDVPARLSKNEFVFTADAVRNAGEGDVDKGAEVMYNMMKNLESGGEVSEESQGLSGARKMFQTSKRLEEVL